MYLLGFDVGSSSVKASLIETESGKLAASGSAPKREMEIIALQPGWAEQHPQVWWDNLKEAVCELSAASGADLRQVQAVGISYQMHGLVAVDRNREVVRPSIIWCDSRAVEIGNRAFSELGKERCLQHLLNSPGNFTASKLKWVMENEPEIATKIDKIMVPGDYIAMKLTGDVLTTPSGLSEAILWDFQDGKLSRFVLDYFGIPVGYIPPVVPTFLDQGRLTTEAATELGLKPGTPVTYRSGDQPNNALSLNVLDPGEVAATAGTSGVVYGVSSEPDYDPESRFNTFVHVNHGRETPRYGNLLCLNGTAILYSWLKHNFMTVRNESLSYDDMDELADRVPAGSEGLAILPYGNGAERILQNLNPGATIHGLGFNIHTKSHVIRAAQEGIVFALKYGIDIMKETGVAVEKVRAGYTNMFLSGLFAETFATVTGASVELYRTDGSQGAARGAGIGAGIYDYLNAFDGLEVAATVEPRSSLVPVYEAAYSRWLSLSKSIHARAGDC